MWTQKHVNILTFHRKIITHINPAHPGRLKEMKSGSIPAFRISIRRLIGCLLTARIGNIGMGATIMVAGAATATSSVTPGGPGCL